MTHKFLLHTFVGLLAAAALSACNNRDDENNDNNVDDNDNTITVAVENGSLYNDKIDAVKALVGYDVDGVGSEVGSAPYANGGFTLQLQANVDAQYLEAMFADDDDDGGDALFAGATISNPNVKGTMAKIVACKSGKEVGEFRCGEENDYVQGVLVYVDGDVSVTGSAGAPSYEIPVTYTFNLHLKKGWSMIYTSVTFKNGTIQEELTATAPSEARWLFSAYSTVEIIDNTVTATIENGNDYNNMIDTVKALVFPIGYDDIDSEPETLYQLPEVGSGPYANGGFTLRLQASVDEQYLEPMFEGDIEDPFAGATVSNPNVKGVLPIVVGYKSGELVAFISAYTANGFVAGQLVYVDGDVDITGSVVEGTGEEEFSYVLNLHLTRGWNMMYVKENANEVEVTTTPPTSMAWTLAWIYDYDYDYDQQQPLSGASLKKQLRASSKRLQASSKPLQAPSKRMKKALKLFR